jgi:hypothetical protein
MNKKVPLVIALIWIIASTLIVVGSGYSIKRYLGAKTNRSNNPNQKIVKILQRGSEKEALSSRYLAELLSLSIDRPSDVRNFDVILAEKKLRSSPVIEKAKVSLNKQGTVVVDYEARHPIALLYDYANIAVDGAGVPFPLYPFYSPKNLTEIFLGEDLVLHWNQPLIHPKMELALKLFKNLALAPFALKRIDVSNAFAESYGKRQIVLVIEEYFKITWQSKEISCIVPRILRLSAKDYRKDLGNYLVLRDDETLAFDPQVAQFEADGKIARLPAQVVDFRISNMAFIK